MSIRDMFALPRCQATAIMLPEGAWEYRSETDPAQVAAYVARGWRVVDPHGAAGVLLKYTHQERYP